MPADINQKILAAFQTEHKEHLEGIRALLAKVERIGVGAWDRAACLEEAFRMAHSLKGGARVCDLRPAETLAHRLESVFERVRRGELSLDENVIRTVGTVLDTIEDWMAGLDGGDNPVDPGAALSAVDRLFHPQAGGGTEPETPHQSETAAGRILDAFRAECPKYVAELRRLFAQFAAEGLSQEEIDEAYRVAHNLRGSAQAADFASIEQIGAELESLIGGLSMAPEAMDPAACERICERLHAVEGQLNPPDERLEPERSEILPNRGNGTFPVGRSDDPDAGASPVAPSPAVRSAETVRVSTESLDRVLRSSGQLLSQSAHQQQMGRELEAVRRRIGEMDREREAVRGVTAANLHRLSAVPEFTQLVNYLDSIDRGIHWLARRTRRLCMDHKRHALSLDSCGRRLQHDLKHARMVPAEAVFPGLRKSVRDLAKDEGKQVELHIDGFDVRADRMVFQALKDPLFHMLRNCVTHGIETPRERVAAGKAAIGRIGLRMETHGNRLVLEIEDDGRGLDVRRIAARGVATGQASEKELAEWSDEDLLSLIFRPGFSTSETVTEISGRGMGLSVVQEAAARLQGEVEVRRNDAGGTSFRLSVPLSISTHRLLLVTVGECTYALPVLSIDQLLRVRVDDLETIEGKPVIMFRDQPVPVVSLAQVLGGNDHGPAPQGKILHVAVLKSGSRHVAVCVDAFLAERELLIQDLDEFAASKDYFGAVLLNDGGPALVLNPPELLKRFRPAAHRFAVNDAEPRVEQRIPHVLVVDDSFTTRTLEKSILEANGFEVAIAVDGVDGLNRLKCERYDLVIADIEMPRMDGFSLLEAIKQDETLSSIPVILVTSRDRPEDQERGLDLGADAYILKQKFDHQSLLQTIRQIVDW